MCRHYDLTQQVWIPESGAEIPFAQVVQNRDDCALFKGLCDLNLDSDITATGLTYEEAIRGQFLASVIGLFDRNIPIVIHDGLIKDLGNDVSWTSQGFQTFDAGEQLWSDTVNLYRVQVLLESPTRPSDTSASPDTGDKVR